MRCAVTYQNEPCGATTSIKYFRTFESAKAFYNRMNAEDRHPMFHRYNKKDRDYDTVMFDGGYSDKILKEIYTLTA